MTTEATLTEQQARGERAAIAKEFCEEVLNNLAQKVVQDFRESDLNDEALQRSCKYYLTVLDDVREYISRAITVGEDARKQLIRLKEPSLLRKVI